MTRVSDFLHMRSAHPALRAINRAHLAAVLVIEYGFPRSAALAFARSLLP
jgi:hypothetical protein